MRICVVGSGGREHALAVALGRGGNEVVVTPGNPGIPGSVSTDPIDIDAGLFVVGPEAPLVAGLADQLRAKGRLVFGPGADGAQIEGSKAWMKDLLTSADVPTARHGTFTDQSSAEAFLDTLDDLWVIKTDGLAAGKGVLVTESRSEASDAVAAYLSGDAFGEAGRTVVIEEGMSGPELSILAICDGTKAVALAPAQDFKRIGDGDTGPNTGGMGAYSPVPLATEDVTAQVLDSFVAPTLHELNRRDIDYRGVLYAGLMMTPQGPKLLEYNCRLGDPETQVVLPRLTSDLADLLAAAGSGDLADLEPTFTDDAAVTVVCATEGYPVAPRTGDVINGLDAAQDRPGVEIYCAGVASDGDGQLVTSGGRVLAVTALDETIEPARAKAYDAVADITWPGRTVRNDIAAAPNQTAT